ncbi:MAG: dithiol-disulfide isomerase [Pelagibacteraceae bacterium BACL5 MAG-120705-bin12]|jgi:predicted DsbA family dithiol-disulfide isomerase|nr:MAG: dithiol-disulfide isomerase [Pelagibacteraceae bacterium BACL5 MAG-120705-bin12]KRO65184.1 MAG: dithiol-disulfide isomerase [Pelagibacteraceae bacterium BACL5 MAG-120820-bin39]MDA1166840.1 DsbA family protein [Pseudomonadota bacterium]
MNINFFADTICGWCFIGHRNLNSALKKFPKIKFKIKHIPFQLNPDMPAEGILREKYLDIKFGGRNNAVPMYENMRIKAKESGIILNLDKIKKTPNTILSHLLIILSEQYNLENVIKEKIYQSYFVGGLDIGDKNILSNIAEETSIKKETFEKLITQENINKINEKVKFAKDKKVFGVPYFEIGKDFVSGAQNSIELEKIIKTNLN